MNHKTSAFIPDNCFLNYFKRSLLNMSEAEKQELIQFLKNIREQMDLCIPAPLLSEIMVSPETWTAFGDIFGLELPKISFKNMERKLIDTVPKPPKDEKILVNKGQLHFLNELRLLVGRSPDIRKLSEEEKLKIQAAFNVPSLNKENVFLLDNIMQPGEYGKPLAPREQFDYQILAIALGMNKNTSLLTNDQHLKDLCQNHHIYLGDSEILKDCISSPDFLTYLLKKVPYFVLFEAYMLSLIRSKSGSVSPVQENSSEEKLSSKKIKFICDSKSLDHYMELMKQKGCLKYKDEELCVPVPLCLSVDKKTWNLCYPNVRILPFDIKAACSCADLMHRVGGKGKKKHELKYYMEILSILINLSSAKGKGSIEVVSDNALWRHIASLLKFNVKKTEESVKGNCRILPSKFNSKIR